MFSVVLRIIFSKINLFERVIKVLFNYKRKAPYSELLLSGKNLFDR